ncbi:hypothetical protein IX321_000054 [Bacteroides pyogenes]|nr:hypothetical protein [Bacteroides pyogenes]MBR8707298.1 hypothetical protein [Bacteroides pyogenes]MBR8717358.1 hypothetical protein [Bacteroides pyogenes]MBR8726581.1 hypothetical protein [Bacteroides pyogenes]MBR8739964.1 hypothetical protein [Bacteroides pyogenes]
MGWARSLFPLLEKAVGYRFHPIFIKFILIT